MIRLAPLLALGLSLASAHLARADTDLCQTINGRTTCTHAGGNVRCTTLNGETRCTALETPDLAEPPADLPAITVPGVDIRSEDGRLHVRAGGTVVDVPRQ
ncbi:MAG TPA: hypothetical protein VK196_16805 [Magnetospirillum sp.]|nr:hypothetical protein [Magnetospirillum sp.]